MSFLTDSERQSLSIKRMILHVIGGDTTFQAQPEFRDIEHQDFFLARLMDAAASSVHEFEDNSLTKAAIERIASGQEEFEIAGQMLSQNFGATHPNTSRDGAFFIFELSTEDPTCSIYALVKYDYRQAIEQVDREGRAALRQIIQAFIADRKAIQKSCLIRTRSGVAEASVSARDRMAISPDLTDYFRRFLAVKRERSDQELNRALNEALREIFVDCKELLPGNDVSAALAKAKDALRNREAIDDEAVVEAVLIAAGRPDNEEIQGRIQKSTARRMRSRKIEGVAFRPDSNILKKSNRKRLKTVEGVFLEYPGELENGPVHRSENPSGGLTITTSQRLVIDELVPEKRISQSA